MSTIPILPLLDGRQIPQLGFGTWQIPEEHAADAVRSALEIGYRSIDTAMIYHNERGVGEGIRSSAIPREQVFVTTKVWNADQGYDQTLTALEASLDRLDLPYVDLYLIHWPMPDWDKYVDTWKALIRARELGLTRSIGVSNFSISHIERLNKETGVLPVINQIELHPRLPQRELRDFHAKHRILTESWSPLAQGGDLLSHDSLLEIARAHQRTPAQIILRWHIQLGLVVIPKSSKAERIRENAQLFDFVLSPAEMATIDGLESGGRIGPDPDNFQE